MKNMSNKKNEEQKRQAAEAFERLYEVVETLRGEEGCRWDRAQTNHSLKQFLIEEAYETADAITAMDRGEGTGGLVEELGDVLFLTMLHSEIGRQEGTFTFADVAGGSSQKMIHRHPQVFPDAEGRKEKKDWDALKKEEKAPVTPQEEMEQIPHCFPALLRTQKVQKKMQKYDGTGGDFLECAGKAETLLAAAKAAGPDGLTPETGGELLYQVCNLLRLSGMNSEQLLKDTLEIKLAGRASAQKNPEAQ